MAVYYVKLFDVNKQIAQIKDMGGNARLELASGNILHGRLWNLYIDRIDPKTDRPQRNFKVLSYEGLAQVSSELDSIIGLLKYPSRSDHPWYRTTSRLLLKNRKHKTRKKRIVRQKRRVVRRKIPLRTARAMVRAGLPVRRSDLRGNQSRFQRGLNKKMSPEMKERFSNQWLGYHLARIVEAIKNLKKRNYNDEMIESVVVKERPGRPKDFIIIVKHRYYVNGARVYSAGLKTEETIEKFVRVIGTKTKRIGNSDYVFNVYGVRFPEAIQTGAGKLFPNPKSFPNIDKSKFNKGQYVGYSPKAVNVFSIARGVGYRGWRAIGQIYKTNPPGVATKIIYGKDLAEISKALENL